ncbi:MAG: hypothetical protein FWC03_02765 [Treponema sp.]|nr:hypothetical protein [Treponema sp.]
MISFKKSVIFLLGGFFCAIGTAFLINFLVSGPKLGPIYDFFLSQRQTPSVAREILIINTDEFVESGDIFNVLMAMTELDASYLIVTARVTGSSSLNTGSESEIRMRFSDEYDLLGGNIRNLFDAIRSGLVSPVDAPFYVDSLVGLTEQSKERLLSALIERDEDLIRSISVFGNYLEAGTEPLFDSDGILRRVQPVEPESSLEHPVYRIIKQRYAGAEINHAEEGLVLLLRGYDGNDIEIPLDKNGNIITGGQGGGFRRINITIFREYEEAWRVMRNLLKEANELGALSQTLPEYSPLYLDDYAADLRQELLRAPDNEKRAAWKNARSIFFRSLEDYLFGPAEMILIRGYEEVIADEEALNEEELAMLTETRNKIIASFNTMREQHSELVRLHSRLADELSSSFCIIGTRGSTEYSALLANALITGSHIKHANDRYALFWSAAAAFVILLIIFRLRPALLLISGLNCGALAAAAFGWSFIINGYWIDPVIVLGASAAGTLVIFLCRLICLVRRAHLFRSAYGAVVSGDVLQNLICSGKPQPSEVVVKKAAVVAIKDIKLLTEEDQENPDEAGSAQKIFFSAAKEFIFNADAVVTGYEKDTIFACFGSPLNNSADDPVNKAYAMIRGLLRNEKASHWCFGMDTGECTFSWSPETGFTVNGRPAVRAKILVSKTTQYRKRALVSNDVRDKINIDSKEFNFD